MDKREGKNGITPNQWDLVYLIHCALHGKQPDAGRVAAMDIDALYTLADFHTVTALGAKALNGLLPGEAMAPWKEAWDKALRKSIVLDMECKQICAAMESFGIWYMPLKGYYIKHLYPSMELRQMSDQDILFDTTQKDKMRAFMRQRGYTLEDENDEHHDIYQKPPVYNFELHHTLVEDCEELKLGQYYQNVRALMIPDAPGSMGHHLSDEDFYVYMIAHACKHYFEYGTGLRSFVDIYLYIKKKGEGLNWEAIDKACAEIGMDWYEKICRSLSMKLYAEEIPAELTVQELDMLKHTFNSGTYGTKEGSVAFKMKQIQANGENFTFWTKCRYLLRRLFPSLEIMKRRSPMVKKYPWTLPLGWIVRLFRGLFQKGKLTAQEIGMVMDMEDL